MSGVAWRSFGSRKFERVALGLPSRYGVLRSELVTCESGTFRFYDDLCVHLQ